MAYFTLVLAVVFAFIIALFAVQNSMMVNVTMLKWNIEASLVLVILGAASLGFLLALSLQLYVQVRLRFRLYKAQSRIKQLEQELGQFIQPDETDHQANAVIEPEIQPEIPVKTPGQ